MHQSKKELIARQWNQKLSFEFQDKIEKEEVLVNELAPRGIEAAVNIDMSNKK